MPILKAPPIQPKNETLQLRVSTELKQKLQHYAEFLVATPSYVVIEALNRIFDKDREFNTWLEQHSVLTLNSETESRMETKKES